MKIGIIVADVDEYKPLAQKIEEGEFEPYSFLKRQGHKFQINSGENTAQVISLLCGIGKVNATAAAAHFADIGCDIILNYGLSGGISGVRRGDLCLCDRLLEHDFDLTGIGYKPCEKPCQEYIYNSDAKLLEFAQKLIPNVKIGTAVSGDSFICDEEIRQKLKTQFSAMSCDMETAAIAYVCNFADIPFLALRRISDDAGSDAKESYREMNSSDETLLSDYILQLIEELINCKSATV